MKALRVAVGIILCVALFGGCTVEVWVQPATDRIENVQVEDVSVPVEGRMVEVSTASDTLVTWEFEGRRESETIAGFEVDEGASWIVYASYIDY